MLTAKTPSDYDGLYRIVVLHNSRKVLCVLLGLIVGWRGWLAAPSMSTLVICNL